MHVQGTASGTHSTRADPAFTPETRARMFPPRVSVLDAFRGWNARQLREYARTLEPQPDGLTAELLHLRADALEVGEAVAARVARPGAQAEQPEVTA
jgi:hypothetical protein